jgi:hypothetical protein
LSNLYLKTIILPRQAQDKHRKSWEQEALFAGNHVSDRAIVATLVEGAQTWGGGPHLVCAAGATHAPPDKTINWSNDQLVKLTINWTRTNPFSALLQTNGKGTISAKGRVDHRIVGDVKVRKNGKKRQKTAFFSPCGPTTFYKRSLYQDRLGTNIGKTRFKGERCFLAGLLPRGGACQELRPEQVRKTASFLSAFPMFVPSLSW